MKTVNDEGLKEIRGALAALQTGAAIDVVAAIQMLRGLE